MSSDEQLVIEYLEQFPGIFISPMEVSKRAADRERFKSRGEWARPILHRLAQQGDIDSNEFGHYRAKGKAETKRETRDEERQPKPPIEEEDEGNGDKSVGAPPGTNLGT
jgi:hypothetical protein